MIGVGGCLRTTSIDERVARLVGKASEGMASGEGTPPVRPVRSGDLAWGRGDEQPATNNPPAESLRFAPAPEKRDVAARLGAYALDEGVPARDASPPDGATVLTLGEAWRTAQRSGRELLNAQEQYLLAGIALLVERHAWGPRFFNDTSLTLEGQGDDGDFSHAAGLVNSLRATQRLPAGGSVEAAWVWRASEQLRETAGGRYRQSSEIVLSGTVPLLRGAGREAREELIQRERDLVYEARTFERFRRSYLVDIANDYYELLNTRATIANQERRMEALKANERRTAARVAAGRVEAFENGIAANEVLDAQASLAGLREQYILQLERFKIRLGLPAGARVWLAEENLDLPEPEVALDVAGATALDLRLDLQNQRDRLEDARRAVAIARRQLLPDLGLRGSVTVPTDPGERVGGVGFDPDQTRYEASLDLGLPLDRERERLGVRRAVIGLQAAERDYERRRDEVVVAARAAVRAVELARFQLTLAEQQVEINLRRKRGQELQADTIDTQRLVDTENALAAAENQRDRARTNLRSAVLNYLLESDQLRVRRDGTLEPLPGLAR